VVEQMAAFPNAEHDDLVDSTVQAMLRFRQGGLLRLQSDEEEDGIIQRKRAYY
jgi:phage terminase large subunit-like protein